MESRKKSNRKTPPPAQEVTEATNKIISDAAEPPKQEEFIEIVNKKATENRERGTLNSEERTVKSYVVQVPDVAWANSSQTLIRIGDHVVNINQAVCIDLGATEVVIHFSEPVPISDVKPHRDRYNNLVSWKWVLKEEVAQKLKQLLG